MAEIRYAQISEQVEALAKVLYERGYPYSTGYMVTLMTTMISNYVPQINRQSVMEDIQMHIDSLTASKEKAVW